MKDKPYVSRKACSAALLQIDWILFFKDQMVKEWEELLRQPKSQNSAYQNYHM